MKPLAVLLIALCTVATLLPGSVHAAPLGIPAAAYPSGAHISYRPALTNSEMDCMWGFVCDTSLHPNFHLSTQSMLHRLSGWGQFAGVQRGGRMVMAFQLFVSRYDPALDEGGTAWSTEALLDLTMAIHSQGYRLDRLHASRLLAAPGADTLLAARRMGKQDLTVMALRSGALEIEGIALYDHRPAAARRMAWASLAQQIHLASENAK